MAKKRSRGDQRQSGGGALQPLVVLGAISIAGAIVALCVTALQPSNPYVGVLSNFIVFVASSLLSYFITYSNERQRFQKELATLAAFARRRVFLLSQNLLSLSNEAKDIESPETLRRIVAYTLANLEQDAHASVREIEELGGIPEEVDDGYIDRSIESSIDIALSPAPTLLDQPFSDETHSHADEGALVTYSCLNCGMSNSTSLRTEAGSTKHVDCTSCQTRLLLHRIRGGGVRVVNPLTKRLSNISPSERTQNFHCPRCQNRISYQVGPGQVTVEKPCFSCLSVVVHDVERGTSRTVPGRFPIAVEQLDIPQMDCTRCGIKFSPRIHINPEGKRFVCCNNCNSIFIEKKEEPYLYETICPEEVCQSPISFRVKESEPTSLQICFECKSRLSYDKEQGIVSVLDKLDVPSISREEFRRGGRHCPHCNSVCSDGFRITKTGEKVSMCWGCKNIFEFVEEGI